jgi:hypothetical protein
VVRDLRAPTDAVKYAHLRYSDEERAGLRQEPLVGLPPQQISGAA